MRWRSSASSSALSRAARPRRRRLRGGDESRIAGHASVAYSGAIGTDEDEGGATARDGGREEA